MKAREGEVACSAVMVSVKCRTRSNGLHHCSLVSAQGRKDGQKLDRRILWKVRSAETSGLLELVAEGGFHRGTVKQGAASS